MIRRLRQWVACRRLNRLVAQQREAYETRRYRERREAAKLGWQRRTGTA